MSYSVHVHHGKQTEHFRAVEGTPRTVADFVGRVAFGGSKVTGEEPKASGTLFRYFDGASAFVIPQKHKPAVGGAR